MRWALTIEGRLVGTPSSTPLRFVRISAFLLELDLFPIGLDLFFGGGFDIPINVRVTVHEFVAYAVKHIGSVKNPASEPNLL